MTKFTDKEKSDLQQCIQINLTKGRPELIALIGALILNIDVPNVTLKETFDKIIQELKNMNNGKLNQDIVEILTDESKAKEAAKKINQELSKLAAESQSNVKSVKSKKAKQLTSPVDKITQILFDKTKNSCFYGDEPEITKYVGVGKKKKAPVTVMVTIDVTKLKENITLSNDVMLNPFNRVIHDAVISLYCEGNSHFTEDMIYRLLNGYRRLDKTPDGAKQDIHNALTKLMYTGIEINTTNEAKAFRIKNFTFKGYVLPLTYTKTIINGVERESWNILEKPPLLALAERKKQITNCDIKLLDTGLNLTQENITLTHYLLEQILIMQNEKSNRNNTILYDTVYEYLGVDAPNAETTKTNRKRIRERIRTILDAWTEAGFIENYGEFLEGRKFLGVHVKFKSN